jgi:MFS transporter, PAT family, solute carrier family 33 (acetyl-CoA transportor), member 1
MRTRSGTDATGESRPPSPTTGNSTITAKNAITTNTKSRRSKSQTKSSRSPPSSARRRKTEDEKMNNAENHAAVEIKRKQATEDSRYDVLERGEKPRNFEKPDKPDDNVSGSQKNTADGLSQLPPEDLKNVGILAALCTCTYNWVDVDLLQGIPVGLAFGSVPFLLKAKLSYGQVGIFSLASYPYSMKLAWSPIVDAIYSRKFGRRKSWIVPIQFCSALLLLWLGSHIEWLMEDV